jgi:hypothetical protein
MLIAAAWLLATLAITIGAEVGVAALFRVGRRGLKAVVLVNLITNPLFNLAFMYVLAVRSGLAVGLPLLELGVIAGEWKMLEWALSRTAGSSRKLLIMSVVMNVASIIASVVSYMAFCLVILMAMARMR